MKRLFFVATLCCLFLPAASAQNDCGQTATCVTSFNLSPSEMPGDDSHVTYASVSAVLAQGADNFLLEFQRTDSILSWICMPPATFAAADSTGAGFEGGCHVPGNSAVVALYGYNGSLNPEAIQITARNGYSQDVGVTSTLTLDPLPANTQEPPYQNPDTRCANCSEGSPGAPSAGGPINLANGNTWITEQDYTIPGLSGGLTLTRTWNSLWSLMQPVEESGIFGDSWRSNFEERIQVRSDGTVKYWKGDGSSLFYAYSYAYYMTAPLDDPTTLSVNNDTGGWIIGESNGTKRYFNFDGYLTSIVDRNGNTISISVDANNQNRIASLTDAANRTLTFSYGNTSFPRLCTAVTDATGTVAYYSYDTSGRLVLVTYGDGSQYNFTYNSGNLITAVTDAQAVVLEQHTYDSQQRGLTSSRANGVDAVTVSYSSSSPQTSVSNSLAQYSTLTFNTTGQRQYISQSNPNGGCDTCGFFGLSQTTTMFASTGKPAIYTDPSGKQSFFQYDSQGNLTTQILPEGSPFTNVTGYDTWSYTYNSFGEALTSTDPLGGTTTNTYDSHGNLLSRTTPSPGGGQPASTMTFTYDSKGQLLTITDPLNNQTTLTYYATGLIHTITDATSNATTYAYDARGNRTSVTDADSQQTQFQYDSGNRLTKIIYPDSNTVQFGYDARGRRTSVTDQNGKQTQYDYDDTDRLTSVTGAASNVTHYGYDTENDLTSITDAASHQTQISFLEPGIPLHKTFPSGYVETTWFDQWGNVLDLNDRLGNDTYSWVDFQDRLVRKYTNDGYTFYTYDGDGRLTQVQDGTGTYTFAYDGLGRLTQAVTNYSFLTARNFTVSYTYDKASNRVTMTDPEGTTTSYGFDTLNRLTSLSNSWAGTINFGYDALSRRTSLTRPNGVNTSYSYDNLSHLLSVTHQNGSTTLDGASYTYDAAGNRLSKTDLYANVTSNYSYDDIYQLTGVTQGTSTTENYTYDAVGNRLTSLGVSPYTYNSSNELTSTPSGSYTYDHNGNMLTRTDGAQFSWDYSNRLSQVILPSGGGTITFKYDPFGRRIQKSGPSGTVNYVYDGMKLLEEVDNNGNATARYAQGPGIDQPLAQIRSGSASYYHQDGLSSVTSLSNSAGALANTYTYDSYGKLTASTGSTVNPTQYTGREVDAETGAYFYRARYYDQNAGRFLNEDPLGFEAGIDFYQYAADAPNQWNDAYGLKQCKSCGIAKAPEYDVSGTARAGTWLHWGATFQDDATHDPSCCEVRQLVSWNEPWPGPYSPAPHRGFQPPRNLPGNWYEDRDENGKRYGRRTGPYSDLQPGGDWYSGDQYSGQDEPGGPDPPSVPGFNFKFRLIVVDVCNGGKTIYTSRTITVNY